MRGVLTAAVWAVSLACVGTGALVAAEFVFMATSMDPTDILTEGTDSWWDAGVAIAAFAGLGGVAAIGLMLWHSRRFKLAALAVVAAEVVAVSWTCAKVYGEYF